MQQHLQYLAQWYENLAKELNVPLINIDVPFNHEFPVTKHAKQYIVGEFKHAIKQLEDLCGRPFDYDKFFEVQKQTQRSIAAWNKIATYFQYKPSPLNGFDLFNYMGLAVAARSLNYSEITFNKFLKELDEKVANKNGLSVKTKNPVLPGKVSLSGSLSATPSKNSKVRALS